MRFETLTTGVEVLNIFLLLKFRTNKLELLLLARLYEIFSENV